MAKIRNPITFSRHFGIDPVVLEGLDVLDPTLSLDTKLFVDPLLLEVSQHEEMHKNGAEQYRRHFETVIKFLTCPR